MHAPNITMKDGTQCQVEHDNHTCPLCGFVFEHPWQYTVHRMRDLTPMAFCRRGHEPAEILHYTGHDDLIKYVGTYR